MGGLEPIVWPEKSGVSEYLLFNLLGGHFLRFGREDIEIIKSHYHEFGIAENELQGVMWDEGNKTRKNIYGGSAGVHLDKRVAFLCGKTRRFGNPPEDALRAIVDIGASEYGFTVNLKPEPIIWPDGR